jgi:hypothetical protein
MRKTIALMITAAAFLSLASLAAAEVSRETYKAEVEPICEANTKANEKTLKNVKQEVKKGKLKPASIAFTKAAKALKSAHSELEAVAPPEADKATITKWLGQIKTEIGYFEAVAKKLKQGNKNAAEKMVIKLTHNVELANDTVLGFDFHYCKANTAKFT